MKKRFYFLMCLMVFVPLLLTNCEVKEEEDICAESVKPQITRGFSIDVVIMFSDNVPWEGLVTMEFYKQYCDGKISGEYTFTDFCDEDGYYYPGAIPTYDLANSADRVFVRVSVIQNEALGLWIEDEVVYYYEDVKGALLGVNETYEITLPWPSDAS